jgi:hypothetical protein
MFGEDEWLTPLNVALAPLVTRLRVPPSEQEGLSGDPAGSRSRLTAAT